MSYFITAWIAFCVGFVLGAAWCGLGGKNQRVDRNIKKTMKELYD